MASTSTRNVNALRASIKHEDAALESRLPTPKAGPEAETPAPDSPPATAATKPAAAKVATQAARPKTVAKPAAAPKPKPVTAPTPPVKAAPTKAVAAKPAAAQPEAASKKSRKIKPEKTVQESFKLLASEHAQIKSLRQKLAAQGVDCNKSGVLRAGLAALNTLDDAARVTLVQAFTKAPKSRGHKKG